MDRPIKFNPHGKYNLNFIDWQNQWEQVAESGYDVENGMGQSPIMGISNQDFYDLMLQQSKQMEYDYQLVEKEIRGLGDLKNQVKIMKMGKSHQECTICIKKFSKGEIVRILPCKHLFHDNCIMPWFQSRNECPNCRLNLRQHFQKKQQEVSKNNKR